MSRPFIHQVHIADGFADDCEELIYRWLKTDTLTYETFCEIWKDMKFTYLYHGRTCCAEIAELSEELIHIAKHYMVANTSNFEESVAGVFLVYALVNLQPFSGFASLRIAPDDVAAIHRIEAVARKQKRHDVLYILGSLLIEGPVQYHAAARERGMESSLRKYLEGFSSIDQLGVRPRGVFFRQNEELGLLRELASITRRYADAKKAIGCVNNRNLNYTSDTLPSELDASLKQIINGTGDKNPANCTKATDRISAMQVIRNKAMKYTVEGVRHLRSTADKTESPKNPSPRKECKISPKPGKIRHGSPKKPVTSLASRKLCGFLPKKRRRRRKIISSSSSSDEIPSSNENSDENSVDDEENDLNLNSFSKEKVTENEQTQDKEIHITIDSLPAFIRNEQDGKMIEIEIIDKLKTNDDEQVEGEVSQKRNRKLRNNSPKQNIGEGTSSESKETSETPQTNNPVKIEEKPKGGANLKRREKRDLKKTILKSKFKRLGMLDVANFKQSDNTEGAEREKHP